MDEIDVQFEEIPQGNGQPETKGNSAEDIQNAINEVIQSGDFSKINQLVGEAVNSVINTTGVSEGINWVGSQLKYHENEMKRQMEFQMQRNIQRQAMRTPAAGGSQNRSYNNQNSLWNRCRARKVGNISGTLQQIFGIFWGTMFGLAGAVMWIMTFVTLFSPPFPTLAIVFTAIFGVCGILTSFGNRKKKRLKRAERYMSVCGEKMYAEIDELARAVGKSKQYVRKDLQSMMNDGIFPEGHMDRWESCFMLGEVVYEQYLQTKDAPFGKEGQNVNNKSQAGGENGISAELARMITEGTGYINHLHQLNDQIADVTITNHLSRMEKLLGELFDGVKAHPEEQDKLHKVMNYYLPTTVKLVEAYRNFDKVSVPGQNINEAKSEIEKTLEVMNDSFEELLNNMFQNTAFDVTTDAQVLQSMLAREGLAKESNFATMNDEGKQ